MQGTPPLWHSHGPKAIIDFLKCNCVDENCVSNSDMICEIIINMFFPIDISDYRLFTLLVSVLSVCGVGYV